MECNGCYLYGLIRATCDKSFGRIGIEQERKKSEVYTLHTDSIGAVVSRYTSSKDVVPIRKNLNAHHKVIKEVMKTSTIVPVVFGHIASTEKEIKEMLRENRKEIAAEIDRLDGKVEMILRVRWDVENIFEYFVRENPELATSRDRIFGRSTSPSQAELIEIGRMFEWLLNQERAMNTERLLGFFVSGVADTKMNHPKDEKTVVDIAFLIDKEDVNSFEEKVFQAAGDFPDHFVFDYNGPWAPFSFVEMVL